jgi:hypothetical protein
MLQGILDETPGLEDMLRDVQRLGPQNASERRKARRAALDSVKSDARTIAVRWSDLHDLRRQGRAVADLRRSSWTVPFNPTELRSQLGQPDYRAFFSQVDPDFAASPQFGNHLAVLDQENRHRGTPMIPSEAAHYLGRPYSEQFATPQRVELRSKQLSDEAQWWATWGPTVQKAEAGDPQARAILQGYYERLGTAGIPRDFSGRPAESIIRASGHPAAMFHLYPELLTDGRLATDPTYRLLYPWLRPRQRSKKKPRMPRMSGLLRLAWGDDKVLPITIPELEAYGVPRSLRDDPRFLAKVALNDILGSSIVISNRTHETTDSLLRYLRNHPTVVQARQQGTHAVMRPDQFQALVLEGLEGITVRDPEHSGYLPFFSYVPRLRSRAQDDLSRAQDRLGANPLLWGKLRNWASHGDWNPTDPDIDQAVTSLYQSTKSLLRKLESADQRDPRTAIKSALKHNPSMLAMTLAKHPEYAALVCDLAAESDQDAKDQQWWDNFWTAVTVIVAVVTVVVVVATTIGSGGATAPLWATVLTYGASGASMAAGGGAAIHNAGRAGELSREASLVRDLITSTNQGDPREVDRLMKQANSRMWQAALDGVFSAVDALVILKGVRMLAEAGEVRRAKALLEQAAHADPGDMKKVAEVAEEVALGPARPAPSTPPRTGTPRSGTSQSRPLVTRRRARQKNGPPNSDRTKRLEDQPWYNPKKKKAGDPPPSYPDGRPNTANAARLLREVEKLKIPQFRAGRFQATFPNERLAHILKRHVPRYSNNSRVGGTSFFPQGTRAQDVVDLMQRFWKEISSDVARSGVTKSQTYIRTIGGRRYKMSIDRGAIQQFTPLGNRT